MAEQNKENNKNLPPQSTKKPRVEELDAAGRSLSDALKISFAILKVIMMVLIVLFIASGFKTVGPDEQALVLHFGRIRGIREGRILKPGLHWVFPYPIDKIVKIPVEKKINLAINSFWYQERPPEGPTARPRIEPTLDPIRDGYCITRGEKQTETISGSSGSDYNIIHCKWQLTFQIKDPEQESPERFFKNVYVEDVKPGEIYFEVMKRDITPFLRSLFEDAVVTTMVNYTIDQALFEQVGKVAEDVKKLLQEKLDKIESGITVESVQLTEVTWPQQVDEAFLALISASQESQKTIDEARAYATQTLNQAGGPVAEKLLDALENEKTSEQEKELLWSQLAGEAAEKIAESRAYRTKVVETARANAEYLQRMLPEYRKRPELVLQRIYQDTIEYVLDNVDEKFIIQPTEGSKNPEIRIYLNRDPTIKPKSDKEK